jgi:predicted nucleic acid-binding protein
MMYLDTSILIPYFVSEPQTKAVERAFLRFDCLVCISHWTQAEFASSMAKKVRNRECSTATMTRTVAQMTSMADEVFVSWTPTAQDYETSIRFMLNPRSGLRAGDALHLAIAQRNNATLWTLDEGLLAAAKLLKVSATTI